LEKARTFSKGQLASTSYQTAKRVKSVHVLTSKSLQGPIHRLKQDETIGYAGVRIVEAGKAGYDYGRSANKRDNANHLLGSAGLIKLIEEAIIGTTYRREAH
jgi:hypothetical protein